MITNRLFGIVFFLIIGITLPGVSFAQDVIIKKNGDEIKSKILEVSSTEVKYKKFDYIDGPTYIIPKSEVFFIKYANGTREIISALDAPNASEAEQEKIKQKKFFRQHKSYVSLGYGFGIFYTYHSSSWFNSGHNYPYGIDESNASPTGPVYGKFDYGVTEDFSIGINLAFLEYTFKDSYSEYDPNSYLMVQYDRTATFTTFSGLLHANWHFGKSEKIDPYFGLGLGYRSDNWTFTSNGLQQFTDYYYQNFPLGFETTFGIRMKFSEHVGAYVEVGLAKSVMQGGLLVIL